MRVAWHQHILVAITLLYQFVEKLFGKLGNLTYLVADEEFQVHQHLVIPRASAMDFLAHIAQLASEHQFHLRMHVLHTFLNDEFASFSLLIDVFQFLQQHLQFIRREEVDRLKHGDVRHTAQHIILGKIEVHLSVFADGELLNLIRHANLLGPDIFYFIITHSIIVTLQRG